MFFILVNLKLSTQTCTNNKLAFVLHPKGAKQELKESNFLFLIKKKYMDKALTKKQQGIVNDYFN